MGLKFESPKSATDKIKKAASVWQDKQKAKSEKKIKGIFGK